MPVMLPQPADPNMAAQAPPPISASQPQPPTQQTTPPPQAPPAPPQPTAAQANLAHSAVVGHGFKALMSSMGGTTTQYQQTPDGPVPVQQKNSGGDFFRSILAGAILGAGAGADKNDGSGAGYGGAARGINAVQANNQQQQQDRAKQAQQQFQNSQEVDKAEQQRQLIQAQLANMHSEQVVRQHTLDLQDQEEHDRHNAASQAILDHLDKAGGVAPIDNKLPAELSAPDLVAAYTKDPSIRQAPQGYARHFIDKTDASELDWNGVHWTHPDGSPANLTDKTTVKVVDVPMDAMSTRKPMNGKDLNKIVGEKLFDDKPYQVSPLDVDALNAKRLNNDKEKGATALEEKKVAIMGYQAATEAKKVNHEINKDNAEQFQSAYKQIGEQVGTLQKRLADPFIVPEAKKQLEAQIDAANKELKGIREKLFPGTKVGEILGAEGPVLHPEVVDALKTVPGVTPTMLSAVSQMTTQEIIDQANAKDHNDPVTGELVHGTPPAIRDILLKSLGNKAKPPTPPEQMSAAEGASKMGDDIMKALTPSLGGKTVPPPKFPIPF